MPKARILDGAPVAKMRPGAAKRAKTGPRRGQEGAAGVHVHFGFRGFQREIRTSGKSGWDAGSPHKLELRTLGTPQPAGTQNSRELLCVPAGPTSIGFPNQFQARDRYELEPKMAVNFGVFPLS